MRKIILGAFTALFLLVGFTGGAFAAKGEDQGKAGPNGKNDHGLCTAYFNGQKKGHDKNGQPGPFSALEAYAEENAPRNNDDDNDNDVTGPSAVYDYCNSLPKGIGGNPDENGRYTECFDGDSDDNDTDPCND